MEATFIGIDLGTSGCRACLINSRQQLLQEARVELPQPFANNNHIEQDATIWWQAVQTVLSELCQHPASESLAAISVDGTSSTVLVTDADYKPLAPALMYNDARATAEALLIEKIAPRTASAVFGASSSLCKLLWLQTYYPDASHALHQADFIIGQLSGQYSSDFNNCLKLGFDPLTECWPDWIEQLPLNTSLLPEVLAPGQFVCYLTDENRRALGLRQPVGVFAGTTDSIAGFLATGASEPGDATTSLGSTLVIKQLSNQPIQSAEHGIYSHRINNRWLVGGASNAGGMILKQLFSEQQLGQLTSELNFNMPTGLHYYPLSRTGERFPEHDPDKKPQLEPRPASDAIFLQAILEGLTRIEQQAFRKLQELGAPAINRLFTVGGGTKNTAWMHYRAQQLDSEVIIPEHTEACYGTALLAMQGYIKYKQDQKTT